MRIAVCVGLGWVVAMNAADAQVTERGLPAGPFANGDFEQGLAGWDWSVSLGAEARCVVDESVSRSGQRSLRISNATPSKPHTYGVLRRMITGLQPRTTYSVSLWVKGENVSGAQIGGGPGWEWRFPLPGGTYDWQRIEVAVGTEDAERFELILPVGDVVDALWVDDIRFVERRGVPMVEVAAPTVRGATGSDQPRIDLRQSRLIDGEVLTGVVTIPANRADAPSRWRLTATHGDAPVLPLSMFDIPVLDAGETATIAFAVRSEALPGHGSWELDLRPVGAPSP